MRVPTRFFQFVYLYGCWYQNERVCKALESAFLSFYYENLVLHSVVFQTLLNGFYYLNFPFQTITIDDTALKCDVQINHHDFR